MSNEDRCRNFNHGRTNVTISFCTDCGQKISTIAPTKDCPEAKHMSRRKTRNKFCSDCGKKL